MNLKELYRKHYECNDCWYSCPKSGECCNDELPKDECNCGADEHNKKIDELLSLLEVGEKAIAEVKRLEQRDEVWRAKKELLENAYASEVGKVVNLEKELKAERQIWSTEKEQMTDNFNQCKTAAEHWKKKAEDLTEQNNILRRKVSDLEQKASSLNHAIKAGRYRDR
jgi:predicted  nucleic acid-binding Zn-ribbon protein